MEKELSKLSLNLRKEKSSLAPVMVFHLSEIRNIGKNKQRETTEEEAIQYVKKAVQKLKEAPNSNPKEIALLESLLPQMASEEDVQTFLDTLDSDMNKGQIMKAVRDHFGPLVDMKYVSSLVK
jgi:uncharacterized protein YqeY